MAIQGDRLFMSTLDAHVVALDARTGNVIWDAEAGDPKQGYSKKAAPLVVGDKIITGIAGGEFGIRGFLDAYDAQTGDLGLALRHGAGAGPPQQSILAG